MIYPKIKRVVTPFIAFILCFLSLPITIPVSIILALELRGSPLFLQKRPGLNGNPFWLIKFKTMTDARNEHGKLLPDNQRMTKIGAIARRLSLDELPQLINVLMGDMSFIGPRPLLMEYLPLYNANQARRHNVLPGITGWAQVNGRNALTWNRKFELDIFYVENQSLGLDLSIALKTVQKVLTADGVNASESVTMEPFDGNN